MTMRPDVLAVDGEAAMPRQVVQSQGLQLSAVRVDRLADATFQQCQDVHLGGDRHVAHADRRHFRGVAGQRLGDQAGGVGEVDQQARRRAELDACLWPSSGSPGWCAAPSPCRRRRWSPGRSGRGWHGEGAAHHPGDPGPGRRHGRARAGRGVRQFHQPRRPGDRGADPVRANVPAIGVCNVPITGKMHILALLERRVGEPIDADHTALKILGLNHLSWHRGFTVDGEDVWPIVLKATLAELRASDHPEWHRS